MRITAFAKRNIKELLRDPLSYVFCLGFPVMMLLLMTVINKSIPPQANMTVFRIDNLCAGITVFGLTFLMLFAAMLTSKDRTSSFLTRLYASPMTAVDFIAGYYLPLLILAVVQAVITFGVSLVIAAIEGVSLSIGGILLAIVTLIPSMVMFIGFGLFFGCKFSDKAAPGLCSAIISAAAILGGIWMDIDAMGGTLAKICKVLPFYHSVNAARLAVDGNIGEAGTSMLIVLAYTVAVAVLSVVAFRHNMNKDN
ncbi:MAG: ABC transporter permease [Oscillospiraceae bacterium]|nr:ABC transporter permease [Oscillospiraceae bacterium]